MPATTETVLGVFAHVDTTVRALEELRAKGYHDLAVYTPIPVHEIEDVLERDRPVSRVRLFTLIGGLTGTASGFLLTIWSAMQWGLITGGKPVASIPPFVVIAFRRSPTFDRRFTNDRFGVAVHCAPERRPSVREILQSAGADEVRP